MNELIQYLNENKAMANGRRNYHMQSGKFELAMISQGKADAFQQVLNYLSSPQAVSPDAQPDTKNQN